MAKRTDALGVLSLMALTVVFFWKLALTNLIMVGVDIFTYFYPYRTVVNEALARSALPLWNPHLFMGAPLLANGQAGFFYPLNWLFIALPAPQAINYSIVLHVMLAAVFFYLFARDALRLKPSGALLGACVYALGGYTGSLVEHVNQLQAAAWFPLLLWCLDRATRGAHLHYVLVGGGVFAVQLLAGHAQVSYISMAGAGLWLLKGLPVFERRLLADRKAWLSSVRHLALLISMALIGMGLAAIQLLPMLELSRLSIRGGGMTFREAVAFSLPPNKLLESLLPTFGFGAPVFSEYIAFGGVAALMLALIGVAREWRRQPGLLLLLIAGLILALGVYNPLYFVLYKLVPGFGLFRVPARWLFLFAFALAGFSGVGAEFVGRKLQIVTWGKLYRWSTVVLAVAVVVLALLLARLMDVPPLPAPLFWFAVAALVCLIVLIRSARWQGFRFAALFVLVLVELFAATRWLPYNQPTAPEAYSALRPAIAHLLSADSSQPFRVLSYSDLTWDPGDLKDIQAMFAGQLSDEAAYQYTVAVKAKEILAPNLAMRYRLQSVDGYDGGILPLARFVGLQSLFLNSEQINPDGRLRERLRAVPAARWLDLFNVRYVIADKIFDVWVDGIYYDLGLGMELNAGDRQMREIAIPADFEADAIGVVSYLSDGGALANGTPVAELLVTDALGRSRSFIVRAGQETAESEHDAGKTAHARARAVHALRDRPTAGEYHALFKFDTPMRLARLNVRALHDQGVFVLRGMSLVDTVTTTGAPLTFAPSARFRLAHSGDVKVYEYMDVAPRAQVIHRSEVIADDALALKRMSEPGFDPRAQIILAGGENIQSGAPATEAVITLYTAERIVLQTNDPAEGYLLLKDAWYPGWRASVDGQPTAVERADTYFRAIRLSGGAHTVEMRYEPEMLTIGALVSGTTLVLSLALWAWGMRN